MREITESKARWLILTGQAGYWGVTANPPVEHDKFIVVRVRGRFFLCDDTEFGVEFLCEAGVGPDGRQKGMHKLNVSSDTQIGAWVQEELQEYAP